MAQEWMDMRMYQMKGAFLVAAMALGTLATFVGASTASAELEGPRAGYENDLIGLLCSDDGAWLACYYHEPSKCREVVRPLVHSCVERHLGDIKKPINLQTALERNVDIMGCFNQEFPKTIGAKRKDEKRCLEQPKHLK
jgi:hypothetical protein